jgi:nucleotide-binding universal stress UspA family protein
LALDMTASATGVPGWAWRPAQPVLSTDAEAAMIVLKKVLVATDFSQPSDAALAYGRALARSFGASLHVVHVVENYFLRPTAAVPHLVQQTKMRLLDEQLTGEDRQLLDARAVLEVSDEPAQAIVGYAKAQDVDLIVMGTHSRGGLERLLVGSVAEHVVRTAPCPVLTVRHPEREFIDRDSFEKAGCHDSPQNDPRGD